MNIEQERQVQTTWRGMVGIYLFLGGVGAGAYVVAAVGTFLGQKWLPFINAGLTISFPLVIIGTIFLLAHLGVPARAPRAIAKPKTSWISRGVLVLSVFIVLSIIHFAGQVAPADYIRSADSAVFAIVLSIITGLFALSVMLYTGALLSAAKGFPFWRTGLLPVLFMCSGLLTGLFATVIAAVVMDKAAITLHHLRTVAFAGTGMTVIETLAIFFFLHAAYREPDTKEAAQRMMHGGKFVFGDLILGLGVPVVLMLIVYFGGTTLSGAITMMVIAAILGLIGGLILRLSVLSAGMHVTIDAAGFKFRPPATRPDIHSPLGKLPPT